MNRFTKIFVMALAALAVTFGLTAPASAHGRHHVSYYSTGVWAAVTNQTAVSHGSPVMIKGRVYASVDPNGYRRLNMESTAIVYYMRPGSKLRNFVDTIQVSRSGDFSAVERSNHGNVSWFVLYQGRTATRHCYGTLASKSAGSPVKVLEPANA